jgi:hypothetical protein
MGTSVRFWRWRSNPLKRGTDRAEAWAVLTAGLLLAVGAPAAGVATGLGVAASAGRPPTGWHPASAVLTGRAPSPEFATASRAGSLRVRSAVRWIAADGRRHTGQALVRPDSPAGSRTTIWLDGRGVLRDDPADPARIQTDAVVFGSTAAIATALLVGGGLAFSARCLDRRREADLDREWEQIGPEWGPATRG